VVKFTVPLLKHTQEVKSTTNSIAYTLASVCVQKRTINPTAYTSGHTIDEDLQSKLDGRSSHESMLSKQYAHAQTYDVYKYQNELL